MSIPAINPHSPLSHDVRIIPLPPNYPPTYETSPIEGKIMARKV